MSMVDRYGDESQLSGLTGVISAVISQVTCAGKELRYY